MSRTSRANGHTRHEILTTIKCKGAMTAEELGRELSISPVAVRQHLASLEAEDIVAVDVERRGLGRPAHRYRLTGAGDEMFPRRYDALAAELLVELAKWQGDAAVTTLLERHRERTVSRFKDAPEEQSLAERVREIARLQTEQGYMAEVTEDGSGVLRLIKHNCAVRAVAERYPCLCCEGDIPLFKEVLGDVEVVQESRILDGNPCCSLRIRTCRRTHTN